MTGGIAQPPNMSSFSSLNINREMARVEVARTLAIAARQLAVWAQEWAAALFKL